MKLDNLLKRKRNTQYLLYSGKGGVGKTSLAAADALHLSRKGKKVLLISTDPAHSLSDSFEMKIGGEVKKISKNLFAVEIDPKKAMEDYKKRFLPQIEKIGHLKGLGLGDTFDMIGMTPGIDEVAAMDKFMQYMQSQDYDVIIFDTAPTGHTLRFLSLPDVLDSWVGKMIMLRAKLSGVTNLVKKFLPFANEDETTDAGLEQMEAMKTRIENAKKTLSDPEKTHYNIVMIPEEMSILESERSLEALKQYGIEVEGIIVNQIIPENMHCPLCSEKRKQQLERLKDIRKKFKKFKIKVMPLYKNEVKGMKMLEKVGKDLFP